MTQVAGAEGFALRVLDVNPLDPALGQVVLIAHFHHPDLQAVGVRSIGVVSRRRDVHQFAVSQ